MTWRSISTSRRLLLNAKYLKQVLRIEGGEGGGASVWCARCASFWCYFVMCIYVCSISKYIAVHCVFCVSMCGAC